MSKPKTKKRLNLKKDMNVADSMSSNIYNLILGLCILAGLLINVQMCKILPEYIIRLNPIVLCITMLLLSIGGIFVMRIANHIIPISIGYLMLIIELGFGLSATVSFYKLEDITTAVTITFFIVLAMTLVSSIFPKFFLSLGKALFISLLILIIVEMISILITGNIPTIALFVSVGLFSLYIGHDWQKSQIAPKTLKNAVLSAGELYLDIINLFMDILELVSRR